MYREREERCVYIYIYTYIHVRIEGKVVWYTCDIAPTCSYLFLALIEGNYLMAMYNPNGGGCRILSIQLVAIQNHNRWVQNQIVFEKGVKILKLLQLPCSPGPLFPGSTYKSPTVVPLCPVLFDAHGRNPPNNPASASSWTQTTDSKPGSNDGRVFGTPR